MGKGTGKGAEAGKPRGIIARVLGTVQTEDFEWCTSPILSAM